jgi:hypothetical protein
MSMLLAGVTPSGDPLDFYVVAATVIPVLFIAITLEARALGTSIEDTFTLIIATLISTTTILGEITAFKVLATQHPTQIARDVIVGAIAVLGFFVIIAASPDGPQSKTWVVIGVPMGVMGATIAVVLS